MVDSRELSLVISQPEQGEFLQRIEWNKQEFMELVQSAMERYDGVTFTEEQVKEAKEERARLNALKKAVSDRRIQIKKAVMAPYTQFEVEVAEVTALIDRPITEIDRQIKAFEDRQREEKKEALRQHFAGIAGDLNETFPFERVFDRRYLNVSVSLAKAKRDITDKVNRIRTDLKTVESVEPDYRAVVRDMYRRTLDIGQAMGEMYRLKDLRRREDERKAREAAAASGTETAQDTPEPVGAKPKEAPAVGAERPVQPKTGVPDAPPPARDPLLNPPVEKQYKASFTVYGTKPQILSVRQFLLDNGIRFEKGVK